MIKSIERPQLIALGYLPLVYLTPAGNRWLCSRPPAVHFRSPTVVESIKFTSIEKAGVSSSCQAQACAERQETFQVCHCFLWFSGLMKKLMQFQKTEDHRELVPTRPSGKPSPETKCFPHKVHPMLGRFLALPSGPPWHSWVHLISPTPRWARTVLRRFRAWNAIGVSNYV